MYGFFITISNGLLKDGHRQRMGTAVWEFMWCIDKVTRIDSKGMGWVLGGKPIKLSDIAAQLGTSENAVSDNLEKLQQQGYIEKTRTPYGTVIKVFKIKKRFGKNSSSHSENSISRNENSISNKTVSEDSVVDSEKASQDDAEKELNKKVGELIEAFGKFVDVKNTRYYGNKTQRDASKFLIKNYGFEVVMELIPKLAQTNRTSYFQITTPLEMVEKISKVFNDLKRKEVESNSKGRGLA